MIMGPQRYDDRLMTALAREADQPRARAGIWRQLADLLAQNGAKLSDAAATRALAALSLLQGDVSLGLRVATVRGFAAHCDYLPLIAFLSRDEPPVVRALFRSLSLSDGDWTFIMPEIGPVARGVLRLRTDLPAAALRALSQFGSTDFALPNYAPPAQIPSIPVAPAPVSVPAAALDQPMRTDINDLVRRIEEYRSRKAESAGLSTAPERRATAPIAFTASASGRIVSVDGIARGLFIGLDLAEPAAGGEPGCDAAVARLFAKRGPIAAGRVMIAGEGPWSGVWLCDADPTFDTATGRFTGYQGLLRRTDADAPVTPLRNACDQPADDRTPTPADSIRQLMHELRSPLNAIGGFAQLIDGQMFGAVADHYRTAAQSIAGDARRLLFSMDELDALVRLDDPTITVPGEHADLGDELTLVLDTLAEDLTAIDAQLTVALPHEPITVAAGDMLLHLLVAALLRVVASDLAPGERASGEIRLSDGGETVTLCFPGAFGSGPLEPAGGGAPELPRFGMGYSLEIAQRAAQRIGGRLAIRDGQYILNLPMVIDRKGRSGAAV